MLDEKQLIVLILQAKKTYRNAFKCRRESDDHYNAYLRIREVYDNLMDSLNHISPGIYDRRE